MMSKRSREDGSAVILEYDGADNTPAWRIVSVSIAVVMSMFLV